MTRNLAFGALAALGGCAQIIGFPDYGSSTGAGGAGGARTTGASTASSGSATGGSAPACVEGAPCYEGLDGTEGVGACRGGVISCEGGVPQCSDVRPSLQRCDGGTPAVDGNCDGVPSCNGQLRWASGLPAFATAISAGADGAVAVTGTSTATPGNALVAAFDARGRACWSTPAVFGGAGTVHPLGVALSGATRTADGRLTQATCHGSADGGADLAASTVVAGYASGTVDFGPAQQASAGGDDAFVALLGPAGNVVWGALFGSAKDDAVGGVTIDAAGQIYVTGYFEGPATFAGCPATTGGAPAAPSAFVASITPEGKCAWMTTFAGVATGTSIVPSKDGNLVAVGRFTGTLDLGGGVTLAQGKATNNTFAVEVAAADGSVMGTPLAFDVDNAGDPRAAVDFGGDVLIGGTFSGAFTVNGAASCAASASLRGYLQWIDTTFTARAPRCYSAASNVMAFGVAADGANDVVLGLSSASAINETAFHAMVGPAGVNAIKLANPYNDYLWAQSFLDAASVGSVGPDAGPAGASGLAASGVAVDGLGDVAMIATPSAPATVSGVAFPAGQAIVLELSP